MTRKDNKKKKKKKKKKERKRFPTKSNIFLKITTLFFNKSKLYNEEKQTFVSRLTATAKVTINSNYKFEIFSSIIFSSILFLI